MEPNQPDDRSVTASSANLFELQLDTAGAGFFGDAAKWARFLGILGFIFSGLMLLFGIFAGSLLGTMFSTLSAESGRAIGGGLLTGILVIYAIIFFVPSLYLYLFGTRARAALRSNDQVQVTLSLESLKSFFKFYGICAIIVLGIYALAIVGAVIGAAVGSH